MACDNYLRYYHVKCMFTNTNMVCDTYAIDNLSRL